MRREKGLTQEALAEAMGVSRNHVADVELGVRNTGVGSFLLVCRALALPPAGLFEDFSASVLRRRWSVTLSTRLRKKCYPSGACRRGPDVV